MGLLGPGLTTAYRTVYAFQLATNLQLPVTIQGVDRQGATLGYTPGLVDVYLNGLLLPPEDYVATNGTQITFNVSLLAGDVVMAVAYAPFDAVNFYTKEQIGDIVYATGELSAVQAEIVFQLHDVFEKWRIEIEKFVPVTDAASFFCNISQDQSTWLTAAYAYTGRYATSDGTTFAQIGGTGSAIGWASMSNQVYPNSMSLEIGTPHADGTMIPYRHESQFRMSTPAAHRDTLMIGQVAASTPGAKPQRARVYTSPGSIARAKWRAIGMMF
jgi:hypothetical protein